MKKTVLILITLTMILLIIACSKCNLFGKWEYKDSATGETISLRIKNDGNFIYRDKSTSISGNYIFEENKLTLNYLIMSEKKQMVMQILLLDSKILKVKTNISGEGKAISFKKISAP